MTDRSVDQLLRRFGDVQAASAAPPASVAPAVVDRLRAARREDRTWLGRRMRDARTVADLDSVRAALRGRPLLSLAAPLLLTAGVIGVIAAGSRESAPGPDRLRSSDRPASSSEIQPSTRPASAEPDPSANPPVAAGPSGWLVISTKGSLVVVRGDGSERRQLTDGTVADYFPVWSPDGTKIAFVSQDCVASERCPDKGAGSNLIVIDADGTNRRVLRRGLDNPSDPRWLPDGSAVIVTFARDQEGASEVVGLDGSVGAAGAAPPDPALISPDGSQVLSVDALGQIRVAAVDGSADRVLVRADAVGFAFSPIGWTPDGRSVAYQVARRFGVHDPHTWVVGRDGSDPHEWTDLPEGGLLVGWSADRRWMLLLVRSADGTAAHFIVANGEGTRARPIDDAIEFLEWTRDRRALVGVGHDGAEPGGIGGSLFVVDPAGARPPVRIEASGLLGFDWRSSG
jgi:hypothetical protein